MSASEKLCPSARCEAGATLLGIVGSDGRVGYLRPALEVDETFVTNASKGRAAEKRFRFASKCLEGQCAQWTGERCSVIDHVLALQQRDHLPRAEELPHCVIRRDCRWHAQSGPRACSVCPFVVTDTLPDGATFREARVPADAAAELAEVGSR